MRNYQVKCKKHGVSNIYGSGDTSCPQCENEKDRDEVENIKVLTQEFLTLENFFAETENKVPKYPVGHAITKIKLQAEEITELKATLSEACGALEGIKNYYYEGTPEPQLMARIAIEMLAKIKEQLGKG